MLCVTIIVIISVGGTLTHWNLFLCVRVSAPVAVIAIEHIHVYVYTRPVGRGGRREGEMWVLGATVSLRAFTLYWHRRYYRYRSRRSSSCSCWSCRCNFHSLIAARAKCVKVRAWCRMCLTLSLWLIQTSIRINIGSLLSFHANEIYLRSRSALWWQDGKMAKNRYGIDSFTALIYLRRPHSSISKNVKPPNTKNIYC